MVRALASHQCVPGSITGPGVICGLSLLLVLFSAPRGFFFGYSGFSLSSKIIISKFQFDPGMHGHFLGAPWVKKLLFTFINVSGNKSSVLSSKGFEKAILEIPHQVHDVVSKTRRTEGYHGRIRTSKCGHEW